MWQQASGGRSLKNCGRVSEQPAASKYSSRKCSQGLVLLEEPGLWPQHLCCVEGQWGVTMPVGICTLCPLGAC